MNSLNPTRATASVSEQPRPIRAFLAELAQHPRQMGAFWPSSPLARAMARRLPKGFDHPVLELGPGTGVVTEALFARGLPPHRLVAVEKSTRLADVLVGASRSAPISWPGMHEWIRCYEVNDSGRWSRACRSRCFPSPTSPALQGASARSWIPAAAGFSSLTRSLAAGCLPPRFGASVPTSFGSIFLLPSSAYSSRSPAWADESSKEVPH